MFRNQSKMVGLKAYDRWFLLLKQVPLPEQNRTAQESLLLSVQALGKSLFVKTAWTISSLKALDNAYRRFLTFIF